MKYCFDEIIDRTGTNSVKYDPEFLSEMFGSKDLLPMWVADMDFKCCDAIIEAIINRAKHGIYGYSERLSSYYDSIINWNKRRNNWDINKDWIVYTPGVVPAINYIIQAFCFPGDKVIIQNPVYYPFLNAILNNGCHPEFNKLILKDNRYVMDYDDLKNKVKDPKAKLLILCSPHNPVGRVWTKEELTELGKICIENDVLVVSDEIHSDLILRGNKHTPFASISQEFAQNSIICTAPSKTFNLAGLQTSNIIMPNKKIRTIFSQILEKNAVMFPNTFGIVATEAAYKHGEEWLEQLLEYLQGNVEFIEKYLEEKMPEIKMIKPEGTYLAWLDFRAITNDEKELEQKMRNEAKIALDEGYIFGDGGQCFERINFACPRSILKDALDRIYKVFHNEQLSKAKTL